MIRVVALSKAALAGVAGALAWEAVLRDSDADDEPVVEEVTEPRAAVA